MPQLDITVFFFEILLIFTFLFFFTPWAGAEVLSPIAVSFFVRRTADRFLAFFFICLVFTFGSRVLAAAMKFLFIFCNRILAIFLSKFPLYYQPAEPVFFAGWVFFSHLRTFGGEDPFAAFFLDNHAAMYKTIGCSDCYEEALESVFWEASLADWTDFWLRLWACFLDSWPFEFFFLWSPFSFLPLIILDLLLDWQDILGYVFLLVGVLLSVAFLTLAERKIMASSQRRMGPNLVGFWGFLQPVADGLKLIFKDADTPAKATKSLFFIAALLPFITAFTSWIIIPLSPAPLSDFSAGPLWVAAMSSLGVYGIIFSGWASNSKYAFLGGLRSAAQVISYELVLSLVYLTVTVWNQTLNFYTIVEFQQRVCWNIFALFPCAVAFLIAMLAETNRTPFDLPEAESELVAGYNVEYRGVLFSLFFLAEYANMILMAVLFSILFLGGWMPLSIVFFGVSTVLLPGSLFFIVKVELILAFFILARAALPRVRYDQLMILGWKYLIPFLFGFFFFVSSVVFFFIL